MPVQTRERSVNGERLHRGRGVRVAGRAHKRSGAASRLRASEGREEAAEEEDGNVCTEEVPCCGRG